MFKFLPKIVRQFLFPRNQVSMLGKRGEVAAAKYLKKQGYRIISKNWKNKSDEIDIVAWDKNVLVFIEVKARNEKSLQPGYYAVTQKKKVILRRASYAYLRRMHPRPNSYRFDIIEVKLCQNGENNIKHYDNIKLF